MAITNLPYLREKRNRKIRSNWPAVIDRSDYSDREQQGKCHHGGTEVTERFMKRGTGSYWEKSCARFFLPPPNSVVFASQW